jgi:hypothetical protein
MFSGTFVDEWGQFTMIPEMVTEMIPEMGASAYTLFCYLRFRTNKKRGCAWPSYGRMHDDLGFGRERISAAIKKLEEADLLQRRKRFGSNTEYILTRPQSSRDSQSFENRTTGEKAATVVRKPNSSSRETRRLTQTQLTQTQIINNDDDGFLEKTENVRFLLECGISKSLVEEASENLFDEDIGAACALVNAKARENPNGYLAKLLRSWIDSEDERSAGLKTASFVWICQCDAWNHRAMGCFKCGNLREFCMDAWAIPREDSEAKEVV